MKHHKTTDKTPQVAAATELVPSEPANTQPDRQEPVSPASQETAAKSAVASREGELQDQLLRLLADFDNFRKRTIRDREEANRRTTEEIMRELLPVLDHFTLGLQAAVSHQGMNDALVAGYEMAANLMLTSLQRFGLKPIDAKGRIFDPNLHEAVMQSPSAECPEGTVVSETRKGYMLWDKLLRASRVVVSGGPAQNDQQKDRT